MGTVSPYKKVIDKARKEVQRIDKAVDKTFQLDHAAFDKYRKSLKKVQSKLDASYQNLCNIHALEQGDKSEWEAYIEEIDGLEGDISNLKETISSKDLVGQIFDPVADIERKTGPFMKILNFAAKVAKWFTGLAQKALPSGQDDNSN